MKQSVTACFILLSFTTIVYAADIPSLPGIPIKNGVVYRGIGPEELTKLLTGKTIYPYRIDTGQLTLPQRNELFLRLSPRESIMTLQTHQIDPSAIDLIPGVKYPLSDAAETSLIKSKGAYAGGLVISASEKLGIAQNANTFPGYSGPNGPVLQIKGPYYSNPSPAYIMEREVFLPKIDTSNLQGIIENKKLYTVDEYLKEKGLTGKNNQYILKLLKKETALRYKSAMGGTKLNSFMLFFPLITDSIDEIFFNGETVKGFFLKKDINKKIDSLNELIGYANANLKNLTKEVEYNRSTGYDGLSIDVDGKTRLEKQQEYDQKIERLEKEIEELKEKLYKMTESPLPYII